MYSNGVKDLRDNHLSKIVFYYYTAHPHSDYEHDDGSDHNAGMVYAQV